MIRVRTTRGLHLFVHLLFCNSAHSRRAGHAYQHPSPYSPFLKAQPPSVCPEIDTELRSVDLFNSYREDQYYQHLTDGKIEVSTVQLRSWFCSCECLALCFPTGASLTLPQGFLGLPPQEIPESTSTPLACSKAVILCVCFSRGVTRNGIQP